MYIVHLGYELLSSETANIETDRWANVFKEINLPFAPFPGLRIEENRPITTVHWYQGDANDPPFFVCKLEKLYPHRTSDRVSEVKAFEELMRAAEKDGWTVAECINGEFGTGGD